MNQHRMRWIFALASTVIVAALFATYGGVSGVTANDAHHEDTQPATKPRPEVNNPVHMVSMGAMMSGMTAAHDFDRMFLDMMIRHHEGAIVMAQVASTESERQEIRDLAASIIENQQAEIDSMRAWRDEWYPDAREMPFDEMSGTMMSMMMSMMSAMATPVPGSMGAMAATPAGLGDGPMGMNGTMDMSSMMAAMADPARAADPLRVAGGSFDQAFLEQMIPHHRMAVVMAQVAGQNATHPELADFAAAIVDHQGQDIALMESWLQQWYGDPAGGASAAVQQVKVTLSEFAVESSVTAFEVGTPYQFVVTNQGAISHEFMIMPHMEGMGQMDMETLDEMALMMIPADDLPPGATQTIELTFSGPAELGELEIVCAVPGHYDAGMVLPISVTG